MSRTSPKPPADLDAASRKVWSTAYAEIEESGVWTSATQPLLELYVRALQTAREARTRIARRLKVEGEDAAYFSKGSMGQQVQHPDLATARQAEADADKYGRELLLSPGARRRVKLHAAPTELDRDIDGVL